MSREALRQLLTTGSTFGAEIGIYAHGLPHLVCDGFLNRSDLVGWLTPRHSCQKSFLAGPP